MAFHRARLAARPFDSFASFAPQTPSHPGIRLFAARSLAYRVRLASRFAPSIDRIAKLAKRHRGSETFAQIVSEDDDFGITSRELQTDSAPA
jgi:hypothetical protein